MIIITVPNPPGRVILVIIRSTILHKIIIPKKDNTDPITLWVLNWLPRQTAKIKSPVEKMKNSIQRDSRYTILFRISDSPLREVSVCHISRNP